MTLSADVAILSALAGTPGQSIRGKKRLQKVLSIAKDLGEPIDAEFRIFRYGPYSADVANVADFLYFVGKVDCAEEQIGPNGYFTTVYKLAKGIDITPKDISCRLQRLAKYLSEFSTVELEVASTLSHLISKGKPPARAEVLTKELKRDKATPHVIAKAKKILEGARSIPA